MKKLLIIATLSIAVAAVIKRVTDKQVTSYWSDGPHITLDAKKLESYISSESSPVSF